MTKRQKEVLDMMNDGWVPFVSSWNVQLSKGYDNKFIQSRVLFALVEDGYIKQNNTTSYYELTDKNY